MVRVDSKGRVVLPSDLRERHGIQPGTEIRFHEEDGDVVLKAGDDPDTILERMDELVAGADDDREPRTPDDELDPHSKQHVDAIRRQSERDE